MEPGSVQVRPQFEFELSSDYTTLHLEKSDLDSLEVCFRRISEKIQTPIFYRDVTKYKAGFYQYRDSNKKSQPISKASIFQFGDLSTSGAITRGVSFGNRQNVFVNSALNLQMDGNLSEDLRISAVITDQNIPYQPEGNTQQLRDFDNVFIKMYSDDFEVIAGDIVLQNPVEDGYFLKYYKNVQGLSLGYRTELKSGWESESKVVGSIAKGQFTSAVIEPQEGVQGPYKLRGQNGERFIIVIANSESVYLDGQLMERGFDRDYVIDYNLGEVTFSNTVVITQFSRIRVDYEYANQYYSRSNISASQRLSNGNSQVYINYYREKDNPNNTLAFNLSANDRQELSTVGDANGLASISGIDSTGYIENAILYEKVDSLGAVIYKVSDQREVAVYQISFTEVGAGKGSYEPIGITSNGRSYEWVGEGRGSFEPIQVIPTPNKRQMIVAGASFKLSDYESVFTELAFSELDQNLYSPEGDGDNQGIATKVALRSAGRSLGASYKLGGELSFEFNGNDFTFIDRFRSVDFDRDWSYDFFADSVNSRQDIISTAKVEARKNALNLISAEVVFRNRNEVVNGERVELQVMQHIGPFQLTTTQYLMNNDQGQYQSRWLRSYDQLQLTDWWLRPGYRFELDRHTTAIQATDSVVSTLMNYQMHDWFLETGDSSKVSGRFDYIRRTDFRPLNGELNNYTNAEEFRLGLGTRKIANHDIGLNVKYRKVEALVAGQDDQENLLGKLVWNGSFWKDHLRSNLQFNTANTRELRREFVFVQVATGDGTHTWRDENEDGIQGLNEFYEAVNPDERNYIKLFTPTDEYIQAYQTTYVHSIDARLPESWRDDSGLLEQLSKVAFNTNLKYNVKTTESALSQRMNPWNADVEDTAIVSARNLVRNTLFFNRNAPGVGFDFTRSSQQVKSLLSGGFELKEKADWIGNVRWAFDKVLTVRGNILYGETVNSSDFLESRNYVLNRSEYGGQVVWQPTNKLRVIGGTSLRSKVTESQCEAFSNISDYQLEMTWIRSGKGNVNATFSWLEIDFEGESNSFLGYELLEALQPGSNQKWSVNWQQAISGGLQMTLQYFGRKSEESSAVHTGSVAVTAFF